MMDLNYIHSECLMWLEKNDFKRVVLQFQPEDLSQSVELVDRLRGSYTKIQKDPPDLYVTQSNTCCVDLIVTQHVSNIDGIIHIGNVCLSKPELQCDEISKPLMFVFGRAEEPPHRIENIINEIEAITTTRPGIRTCILFDSGLIHLAKAIEKAIKKSNLKALVEVASLYCPLPNWETSTDNADKFYHGSDPNDPRRFSGFWLERPIDNYQRVIYIGQDLSIQLTLSSPSDLWRITSKDDQIHTEKINVTRGLNRRMALVERLKDEQELKIGVILTNPLPNIERCIKDFETYAKARKHILYFISMIQTTDEYKIGNFDICDAFVIVNSCTCSKILESLVYNRPILTDLEFKLACGFEAEYGRVLWPGSSYNLSEDDLINKRKVSDVSLALVHTRNELLERCSQARVNKWSGLDFKATSSLDDEGGAGVESLNIEEGLTGIASFYNSEPLDKRGNK